MSNVFVSYSHEDAGFADRLVEDLRYANINAKYDKWAVKAGDSFFEKLGSALSAADHIVVVLSPSSVRSQWVQAELGLAMASQFGGRNAVRVLPVLIQECQVPAAFSDKSYADFRKSYYGGLRQLLEALCPNLYSPVDNYFEKKQHFENAATEFERILSSENAGEVVRWFESNSFALSALFGRLWMVSEVIPRFQISDSSKTVDFLMVNGGSMYEFLAVNIGPLRLAGSSGENLEERIQALKHFIDPCGQDFANFFRCVALRCANPTAAQHLYPETSGHFVLARRGIEGKLICGRRNEYRSPKNLFRPRIYRTSNGQIELVSYDRLLDAIKKLPH